MIIYHHCYRYDEIYISSAASYFQVSKGSNTGETTVPMITIQYSSPPRTAANADAIAQAVTTLSAEILHKDPAVTAVAVEQIDPGRWFIGGKSLARHDLAGFWLDIRLTDGTNTRDEKAAFIAAVFDRMNELIGPLHAESYVHVNEVRGDAYGYGGLTQNERYFAGRLNPAGAAKATA
jgi:4-oxalocrotonate tautomerase